MNNLEIPNYDFNFSDNDNKKVQDFIPIKPLTKDYYRSIKSKTTPSIIFLRYTYARDVFFDFSATEPLKSIWDGYIRFN